MTTAFFGIANVKLGKKVVGLVVVPNFSAANDCGDPTALLSTQSPTWGVGKGVKKASVNKLR